MSISQRLFKIIFKKNTTLLKIIEILSSNYTNQLSCKFDEDHFNLFKVILLKLQLKLVRNFFFKFFEKVFYKFILFTLFNFFKIISLNKKSNEIVIMLLENSSPFWIKQKYFYWSLVNKIFLSSKRLVNWNKYNSVSYKHLLLIDFSKTQIFLTISKKTRQCVNTLTLGTILSFFFLKKKKNAKKQKNSWLVFFKMLKFLLKKNNIFYKNNILILKGHPKLYTLFLILIFKFKLFEFFLCLSLKLNLSYSPLKFKKIKSIKRKLTRRFVKMDKHQNDFLKKTFKNLNFNKILN